MRDWEERERERGGGEKKFLSFTEFYEFTTYFLGGRVYSEKWIFKADRRKRNTYSKTTKMENISDVCESRKKKKQNRSWTLCGKFVSIHKNAGYLNFREFSILIKRSEPSPNSATRLFHALHIWYN